MAAEVQGTRQRVRSLAAWALLVVGVALLDVPLCPFAGALGIPCPGCGMSRAGIALLRGDLSGAWQHHPLVFVVAPLLVGLGLAAVLGSWHRREPEGSRRASSALAALATVLLAAALGVWIARFVGFLGGPAPVETYAEWFARVTAGVTP